MEIKYTVQGMLIYIAIGLYILAFLSAMLRLKKITQTLFAAGFLAAASAYGCRWYNVNHIPLQNLFEVFLFLGMAVYPLSILSAKILKTKLFAFDTTIAAIVLFPAGFIFSEKPLNLPPALQSILFAPHVAVYMLSYIFMAKAAAHAFIQITSIRPKTITNPIDHEQTTYLLICAGFPLLTVGLILGSIWAKLAWGDYWGWDPKEMWSLACWIIYAAYFHFRHMYGNKYSKVNSFLAILGFVCIVLTLIWVNLSRLFPGLHSYAL